MLTINNCQLGKHYLTVGRLSMIKIDIFLTFNQSIRNTRIMRNILITVVLILASASAYPAKVTISIVIQTLPLKVTNFLGRN